MKNILINSLLATFVLIVGFFILDKINPKLNFEFTVSMILSGIVYLAFSIRAGLQERKMAGGILGFGEAFILSFGVYAISSFLYGFFVFFMMKMNPELVDVLQEVSKEMAERTMRMLGMSESEIALGIEEQNLSQMEIPYNFKTTILGWLGGLILPGSVFTLIAALVVRRNG